VHGDGLDDLIVGAFNANLSDKSSAGKSYVVFGKQDSTATELFAIANGTGGFVIHGENTGDNSGRSISSAGSPLMTKPPVPIADRLIATLLILPKMTQRRWLG
jgi:hypothetical protein